MQIIIIIIISILTVVYLWLRQRYSYWKLRGIPFVEPNLIYGNLKGVGSVIHSAERIRELYNQTKSIYSFAGIYFFIDPIVIATDLELIKCILIKDFSSFHDRQVYYNEEIDPLSAHLFNIEGKKWKILRNKLSPTFTSGRMKFMFPTIVDVGERFSQTLSNIIQSNNGQEIETKEFLTRYTTDVIGSCAFGIECNSLNDPNAVFRLVGQKMFDDPEHGELGRMFMNYFPKIAKFFKMRSERKDVTEFFMKVLHETIEYRENNNIKRNDFLDLLIRLKNTGRIDEYDDTETYGTITFEEIAAQAYVFFGGGFETSSTLLGFCFYELALNPLVQIMARENIENVLQKYDGKMTYEALMEMEYIKRVVDETLRKYPVGAFLLRKTAEDYQVPNTDSIIPKDITVIIPVYGLHHDPELFPNPEIFDPNRFTPDMIQQRHSCAYLPFGDGPRFCIAKRFGLMQTYVGLISLLRYFKFSKSEHTQIPLKYSPNTLVLSPEGGMFLQIEKL